jgi:NAD(P)H-dependent flavin oxidoreductase YrpB (nitropropane dioxygenase family)
MGMKCSLAARLGLNYPILQAPIGSLASTDLAVAVSEAGGMGSLALTWTSADAARQQVTEVRRRTARNFSVNFVLSFEPAALNAALEAGAPVVTFSWGLEKELVRRTHSHGATVGVQVGSARAAQLAIEHGSDFVICQGVEAGGHVQSSTPLEELLAAVADVAGEIPVVAAGGLADRADVRRVLGAGAEAAMLGTRFVATHESRAHPVYKQALIDSDGSNTVMTGCFDGGWPYAQHRVLRNPTLQHWEDSGCPPLGKRPGEGDVVATTTNGGKVHRYDDTPPSQGMRGDVLDCCLYAGCGVGRIRSIEPAAMLVKTLSEAS